MKKITLLFAFLLAIATESYGQVSSYGFSQSTGTYTEITGGSVLGTITSDDQRFVDPAVLVGGTGTTGIGFPIGFNFTYNDIVFDRIAVNNNGWISLGQSALTPSVNMVSSNSYTALSATSTATPTLLRNRIGAFAADLNGQAGSELRIETIGTSPNQTLVIQWKGYRRYNQTLHNLNFQIRLNETSNIVDVVYGTMTFNATSSAIQVGLSGTVNTEFNNRTTTTDWNATTSGGVNNATCISLNTVTAPISGTTFSWTPPVPCTGTPVGGSVAPMNLALCSGSLPGNLIATGYSSGVAGLTFQWEESTDGGANYVDAVGGTNATTSVYTPPAYAGIPIQYRLRVTCTNSASIAYSTDCVISNPTTPSTQVTTLASGAITLTTVPLNWVNGNGGRRVVHFSDSPIFTDPIDGNAAALTATVAYAGSGQQIVYDGTGTTVTVTGLTGGTTYYAKVYEYLRCGAGPYDYYYNVTTGTNILAVTTQSPPANDNFANASAISCGNNYTGSTAYATLDEDSAPDGFGADMDAPNVWYTFTGFGTAETVTLDLCASAYDSTVMVYTGTSGSLTLIAANDDDASCTTRSKVNFNSDGTTTYYIAIEGYNVGSIGAYAMNVTCVAVNPPAVANQDCGTALGVNVDATDTISDNSYGTVNVAQPTCDTFGSIQDVWFSFVAPTSGSVDCLVTNGTMTSANFVVYSGVCGTLTEVAASCNSNLTAPTTEVMTALVGGNTYYVQVWSSAAEQGTFTIRLTDPTLSTENFDSNGFSAYPNPVKNMLNLSYTQNISQVSVYNLLGQQVIDKTINANQSQIDMSGLSSGTYMVKVIADNQVKMIKVIKE